MTSTDAVRIQAGRTRLGEYRRALGSAAVIVGGLLGAAAAPGCGGGDDRAGTSSSPPADRGAEVADSLGCTNCHSLDGARRSGPTWRGIWGERVELDDGRTATVDGEYIRRSLEDPASDVVSGYSAVMPAFDLSDEDLVAVIAYIRSLGST